MPRQLADSEKRVLNKLGAEPTVNSGATFGDADGVIKPINNKYIGLFRFRGIGVEVKATEAKSFSVSRKILDKLATEAFNNNVMPLLAVDLSGKTYVVLDIDDFLDLFHSEQFYRRASDLAELAGKK